jgi:hypothetical protein
MEHERPGYVTDAFVRAKNQDTSRRKASRKMRAGARGKESSDTERSNRRILLSSDSSQGSDPGLTPV